MPDEFSTTIEQPSRVPNRVGRPCAGDAVYWDKETGQPTKDALNLIQRAAGMGLPKYEIAALLGMSSRTFYDREKEFEEIGAYIEFGEAEAGLRVANALLKRAAAGDIAAIRWFEMTRKNKAEKQTNTIDGEILAKVVEVPAQLPMEKWEETFSPANADGQPTTDN